jgi:dimethylargininase
LTSERSYRFTNFLVRKPAISVTNGLREGNGADPDPSSFQVQHAAYVQVLKAAGGTVTTLPADEAFPDSVFIEDAALCVGNTAIVLRPGAPTRLGEAALLEPDLRIIFDDVISLPNKGNVDGGDILLSDDEVFIGLSARTDQQGFDALAGILSEFGYRSRRVDTPAEILHFKTDCGLLDQETIFSTDRLARTGCFKGYRVITAPHGEDAAANLIRVNDMVLISAGYPATADLLTTEGYSVVIVDTSEAAKVDGGLSCMSLRFKL